MVVAGTLYGSGNIWDWLTRWNLKCGVRCLSGYVVGTGLAGDPRLLLLLELGLVLFAWLGLGDVAARRPSGVDVRGWLSLKPI